MRFLNLSNGKRIQQEIADHQNQPGDQASPDTSLEPGEWFWQLVKCVQPNSPQSPTAKGVLGLLFTEGSLTQQHAIDSDVPHTGAEQKQARFEQVLVQVTCRTR